MGSLSRWAWSQWLPVAIVNERRGAELVSAPDRGTVRVAAVNLW